MKVSLPETDLIGKIFFIGWDENDLTGNGEK